MATLYVGCAVWAHDDWADNFFPAGLPQADRLTHYARRLTCVEANTTFYRVPEVPTVKKWAAETPESFRFCPKFPKTITHTSLLKDVNAQAQAFMGTMRLLGGRLGPLLLQLPPEFAPRKLPTLARFLESLPHDLPIVVEVRHPDFFTPEAEAELQSCLLLSGAGRAIMDSRPAFASESPDAQSVQERKPHVPLVTDPVQQFALVRYISSPVEAENAPYFTEWAARVIEWLDAGRDVYFCVHCPVERHSPGLARAFYRLVRTRRPKLPPLPWDDVDRADALKANQLSLF
ncbi:MAG: DUF72 domain-containing protein [Aggregatilineales bacterium]